MLRRGPRAEVDILAAVKTAEIGERVLMAAVAALGVQRQDGRWRLPGKPGDILCWRSAPDIGIAHGGRHGNQPSASFCHGSTGMDESAPRR
jgi:hypothetical protein